MARIEKGIIKDKRIKKNIEDARKYVSDKLRKLMEIQTSEKQIHLLKGALNLVEIIPFWFETSTSKVNGYYTDVEKRIYFCDRGMAFSDDRQRDLALHELAHAVDMVIHNPYKRNRRGQLVPRQPHGTEFKRTCRLLGISRLDRASSTSRAEDYHDESYYQKDISRRKERSKRLEYKYQVTCTCCGASVKRKTKRGLVANPQRYQCGLCGGKFKVEEIKKESIVEWLNKGRL